MENNIESLTLRKMKCTDKEALIYKLEAVRDLLLGLPKLSLLISEKYTSIIISEDGHKFLDIDDEVRPAIRYVQEVIDILEEKYNG